jgi:hypothetical protein
MDKNDISKYKTQAMDYIDQNFSWDLENQKQIL